MRRISEVEGEGVIASVWAGSDGWLGHLASVFARIVVGQQEQSPRRVERPAEAASYRTLPWSAREYVCHWSSLVCAFYVESEALKKLAAPLCTTNELER